MLGGELDKLIVEEKDKAAVQERLAKGESAIDTSIKLFQVVQLKLCSYPSGATSESRC